MKKLTQKRINLRFDRTLALIFVVLLNYLWGNSVQAKLIANHQVIIKSGRAAVTLKQFAVHPKGKGKYHSMVKTLNRQQKLHNRGKSDLNPKLKHRLLSPETSTNAFGFRVFDASISLITDRDKDNYYSEFELNFDVDYDNGATEVYAEIYYRTDGGDWLWFYTTEDFQINGNTSADSYSVITELTSGFPGNRYDFLIDIYESGVEGIVDTYSSIDDLDLSGILLEDNGYDSPLNNAISLQSLSLNLIDDLDFDGFYTGFNLHINLDNQSFDRNLYAILYSRDSASDWYKEHTTITVKVHFDEQVEFSIDGLWNTGYETDYYDFLVEIVDADSGEVIADFGPEFQALSARKLESADWDDTTDVIVEENGSAGSNDIQLLFALMLLAVVRRSGQKK